MEQQQEVKRLRFGVRAGRKKVKFRKVARDVYFHPEIWDKVDIAAESMRVESYDFLKLVILKELRKLKLIEY